MVWPAKSCVPPAVLPLNLKFRPGQRVLINEKARGKYPSYVGMYGRIGIDRPAAPGRFVGDYQVKV